MGNVIVDEKITLYWISEDKECQNVNLNLLTVKSDEGLEKRSMNVTRNWTTN